MRVPRRCVVVRKPSARYKRPPTFLLLPIYVVFIHTLQYQACCYMTRATHAKAKNHLQRRCDIKQQLSLIFYWFQCLSDKLLFSPPLPGSSSSSLLWFSLSLPSPLRIAVICLWVLQWLSPSLFFFLPLSLYRTGWEKCCLSRKAIVVDTNTHARNRN